MTLFFTSDLHFGHVRNALEFRGYDSVWHHDQTIIDNWNATVGEDDLVYILGDVCMGKMDESLPKAKQLNGTKFLVPGNHDRVHPAYHHKGDSAAQNAKRAEWKVRYWEEGGMHVMARNLTFDLPSGRTVEACHFPFLGADSDHGDYTDEPRYPEFRPKDTGKNLLVHGHIHAQRRESKDGRQVNVGMDVWNITPVSWETLTAVMDWS